MKCFNPRILEQQYLRSEWVEMFAFLRIRNSGLEPDETDPDDDDD